MNLVSYKNPLPDSGIKQIDVLQRSVSPYIVVHYGDQGKAHFVDNKTVAFLNLAAGRTGQPRLISEDIEKSIAKSFSQTIDLQDGVYVCTGLSFTDIKTAYLNVKTEISFFAPKHVDRQGPSHAVDEGGDVWPIGLNGTITRLNAKSLRVQGLTQSKLDENTVKAASEFSQLPGFIYPDYLNHSSLFMPSSHFQTLQSDSFGSNLGVPSSDVIESLFSGSLPSCVIECSIATQLIAYRSLFNVLGAKAFDEKFSRGILLEGIITPFNPLVQVLKIVQSGMDSTGRITSAGDGEEVLKKSMPGDMMYFSNIEPYAARHKVGNSVGFNVIYMGRNASGEAEFGSLFAEKKTHTESEIIELLIKGYNAEPIRTIPRVQTLASSLTAI